MPRALLLPSSFGIYVGQPTLSSSANLRTITQAASMCIAGPPTTIDSSVALEGTVYSLIVESGSSKFAGEVAVSTSAQFPLYVDTNGCTIAENAGIIVTGNSANAAAGVQYAFQAALIQSASNAANGGVLAGFSSSLVVASGIDLGSSINFLSLDTTLQGSGTVANDIGVYIVQPDKGSVSNVGLVIGVAPVCGTYSLYGSSSSPYLFAGQVQPSNSNPPWAATMNVAVNTANTYTISQTGNTMLSITSLPQAETPIWFRISSDGTSRTATLGVGFLLQGSSNVTPSATKSVYMSFISNGSALVELSRSISL